MTMLSEKVVVTARDFLKDKNINDHKVFNDPLYQSKLQEFDWPVSFYAAMAFCEVVWQASIGIEGLNAFRQLDKLFSPSPIATHANFRGCRQYKTGNVPEEGAIAIWKRGNSWQGHAAIVNNVAEDRQSFSVIEARALTGSEQSFLNVVEAMDKKVDLPFKSEKLNLMGFIYVPDREIK